MTQDRGRTLSNLPIPLDGSLLDGVTGGAGGLNVYLGGPRDNFMSGGNADVCDVAHGGLGDDTLDGGGGDDALYGNAGRDDLQGGDGDDKLSGGIGDDTLTGGRGDDVMQGGWGSDTFVVQAGQSGNDIIVGHSLNPAGEHASGNNVDRILIEGGVSWSDLRIEFTAGGFSGPADANGVQKLTTNSAGVIHIGDQRIEFQGIERIQLGLAG